jgi:thiol:disulfide interchange protein
MARKTLIIAAFIGVFCCWGYGVEFEKPSGEDGFGAFPPLGGDNISIKPAKALIQPKGSILIAASGSEATYANAAGAVHKPTGPGLAVFFTGTDDLHYYADKKTAPPDMELLVKATSKNLTFGEPIFPMPETIVDPAQQKVKVYAGNFIVFFPLKSPVDNKKHTVDIQISGLTCTSQFCLRPSDEKIQLKLDLAKAKDWPIVELGETEIHASAEPQTGGGDRYSWPFAFGLAIVAGLILNVMPCVWPVIPIIVMRIWNQAQESRAKSIGLGLAFCGGILLFFACLALLNIIMLLGFDTVFQWGDQMRSTPMVVGLTLVMIVFGLFMFNVFSIGIPASVTAKAGSGSGAAGSVGMGFLAALLSTPCSGALLAAAFVWAQTQHLLIGTIAIMMIGVGMAIPYLILTSVPGLLSKMPKPGGWMEKVKLGLGFLLLLIAVKFFKAIPDNMKVSVLYYAVILSMCAWVWGWVNYTTAKARRRITRLIAVVLAVAAGMWLLPPEKVLIDWQKYDSAAIEKHIEQGDPVLIKFDADWCFNCEIVKKFVYKKQDVADLIKQKGVTAFKGDTTTKEMPASVALEKKYNEPGVPVTVLHLPGGVEKHLGGLFNKDDLKEILNKLPDVNIEK